MRPVYSLFAAGILSLSATISGAQNSVLMGKITNAQGKPVQGAVIKLSKPGSATVETTSDKDGLYCTPQVQADNYNVTVATHGASMTSKNITLLPLDKEKRYYNFAVTGGKVTMDETTTDPYVAVLAAHSELDNHNVIDRMRNTDVKATERGSAMPGTAMDHTMAPKGYTMKGTDLRSAEKAPDVKGDANMQMAVMMGRVLNSHNKPVGDAVIRISQPGVKTIETTSQKDGLYCTAQMQPGNYTVSVTLGGSQMKTKAITLQSMASGKKYYNIVVNGGKLSVDETTDDPYVAILASQNSSEADVLDANAHGVYKPQMDGANTPKKR